MSQKRATQRRWIVHRTFEPDRLSPATLIQAYTQLVPYHIRVLDLALVQPEAAGAFPDQRQQQRNGQAIPKLTDLSPTQPQLKQSLVIEPITKKEAD